MTDPTPAAAKPTLLDRIKAQLKALAAAVIAALGGVALTTAADPEGSITNIEIPNTTEEWLTFGVAVLVSYLGVFGANNYESVPALRAKLDEATKRVALGKQSR